MTATIAPQRVRTATVRETLLRWAFWAGALVIAVVVVLAGLLIRGSSASQDYLSASNPGPVGTKAVVEVLRQQGVDVTITSSLDETIDAVGDGAGTTLAFYERSIFLDDDQRDELFALNPDLVLLEPAYGDLERVTDSIAPAGVVEGVLDAACDATLGEKAPRVLGDGSGYRILDGAARPQLACYESDEGVFSVIRVDSDGRSVTVLGATDALTNEHVLQADNAALALNVLGENASLVWYVPSTDDLPAGPASISELSPPWVLPSVLLLALTALVVAFWRGRRLGPLIIENLPVTVRASETMQGRARLYETSSARLRALDALRIGTISRIARLCGLPRAATVDEVVNAAAAASGRDPRAVRQLLLDAEPTGDRELVALSDDLLELERTVAERIRPT